MITIERLYKQYSKDAWAIQDISLTIPKGMFGLLGPNGAGKSTFMRMLAALVKPTQGDAELNGRRLRREPEQFRAMVGYLPQFFDIHPQLTGREFLEYVARMKGLSHRGRRSNEIEQLLDEMNLTNKAHDRIRTYSHGMKQRLGIAQAMLGHPDVLILDEPTTGLDPEERVRLRHLLAHSSKERIVVLSTHIVADIESSCQRLAVLSGGRLMMAGDQEQLRAHAEGRVWEMEVTERELARLPEHQVAAVRRSGDGFLCKLISAVAPAPFADPIEPTMEDGYLALLGGVRYD